MLPRVKILFAGGALGQVVPSPDGCFGLLTTGAPVEGKLELNKAYAIRKPDDAFITLGITEENNPGLHKAITEFYNEAGEGVKLWIKLFAEAITMTQMVTLATANAAKDLLLEAGGEIRALFIHRTPAESYAPVIAGGLDGDVATARAAAQLLGEWSMDTFKAPIFIVISGLFYSGSPADLTNLTTEENDRVAIFIGDTVSGDGCAIGLIAGRLARIPVQRNIGRVKDSAIITISPAFAGDVSIETADPESIHDKGYITLRSHVGLAGYYFTDDVLAIAQTDDYSHITHRRTIDKAVRIANTIMLQELLEEIPVNGQGQVSVTYAKSLETLIENAIINNMTANAELGNDPSDQNDTGVECYVDITQNIVSTGRLNVKLRVKPYGYARYIDVELGFKKINS